MDNIDISNFGNVFAKQIFTKKIIHNNGSLFLESNSGKICINGLNGLELSSLGNMTTIKGDLTVNGSFSYGKLGTLSSDSLEGNALVIHGDSIFKGDIDLNGILDISGLITLGSGISLFGGNIQIEATNNLNNFSSTQYLLFGDGNIGSWRIGVSSDNKLNFQRNNGNSWITCGQIGN